MVKTVKHHALPPTYFLIHLILAIGLHFLAPIKKIAHPPYAYFGIVLIGFGIGIIIWADMHFKSNDTTVKPFEKSTCLVKGGLFCFSRNIMYLGMVIMLLGIAIFSGSLIIFLVPVAFFITMNTLVIPHEENDLEQAFGEDYINYKKRVRRWL